LPVCFLFISLNVSSQNKTADSLDHLVKLAQYDTTRVRILFNRIQSSDDKFALELNDRVKEIIQRNLKTSPADTFYLKYLSLALDKEGQIMNNFGNTEKSLELLYKSLKTGQQINDTYCISNAFNSIGLVHNSLGDYKKALYYYIQSWKMLDGTNNNKEGLMMLSNNIGLVYDQLNKPDDAIGYYSRGLEIGETFSNPRGEFLLEGNMGNAYFRKGQYTEASEHFFKALKISRSINDQWGEGLSLAQISNLRYKQNKLDEALKYGKESYLISEKIKQPLITKSAAVVLKKVYLKLNNYKEAFSMFELEIKMRDSLNNDNMRKIAMQKEFEYQYGKREIEMKAVSEAEKEKILFKAAEEKRRQNTIIYSVLAGLLLVAVFSVFLFQCLQNNKKANRIITLQKQEVEQQNKLIEEQRLKLSEKNKEVNDSVNYARGIQHALLASEDYIQQQVPDSFVLFKPKDTVSGDFYWFDTKGDLLLFAVADCTGHGVPGSMMSMIAINLLRLIVNEKNISSPQLVVTELDKKLTDMLHARGHINMVNDGMDIGFVEYNKKTNQLRYCGANRPLWIVQHSSEQLLEIKPDKYAIGGLADGKAFTQHKIQLQPGDALYLTTDGYADQFGGEKGKKMMTKTLKEQLVRMSHYPMKEQKQHLDLFFSNWKAGHEQLDDVTIMGIKIA